MYFSMKKLLIACMGICSFAMEPLLEAKSSEHAPSADYVIVGGGTAGAALARRISNKYSVILLESGLDQDDDPLITDPTASGALTLAYTNKFFWGNGHTPIEPIPNQKRWAAVTGDLLGGGSAVNGMQYVRGTVGFFNEWQAAAGGDPSWGPSNAYQVYKQIEDFLGVPGQYNPLVHGNKGPIDILQAVNDATAASIFVNAVVTLGFAPLAPDYNDPANTLSAFEYWQLTQQPDRTRESSSTAYLQNILQRTSSNTYVSRNHKLHLYTKARAVGIDFDEHHGTPTATGVRAIVNGHQMEFHAKKEVILCTGFQSPILLQLSGIGDESILSDLGIKTLINNPNVGIHAKNHPGVILTGLGNVPGPGTDPAGLYDGGAFLQNPNTPGDRAFEVIGIATPGSPGAFTLASLILNPSSSGFISLYSSDPLRMPYYDFNTFTDQHDRDQAFIIYNMMYQILVQMGLTPTGPAPVAGPIYPNSGPLYDYLFTSLSGSFQSYHYQSGCIMSTSAATGVVDNNGNVFGAKGLRIADTSIVPTNSRGNTQAVAYLVGNIIANKILHGGHHDSSSSD